MSDFEFDDWEDLVKILKVNVNYETNLQILKEIKSYYLYFIETNINVLANLIAIIQKKKVMIKDLIYFLKNF